MKFKFQNGWDAVKLIIGKIYAPFIQMYTIFDQYSVFNSVYQIERMQEKLTYEKQKEVISEQIAEGKGLFEKQAIEKAAASYIIKEFKIKGQSFIDSNNNNQQNLQPQTI
ncbi:hypothetical protein PPERSA_04160 [Pseudocohnilembus persalinus]|uniref:Uncharacterized protein n=1 Tax=Pseudocohnilembus persalinus TaxID=266149 RepID=A0A0V0QNG5_PSEPJ|nr:hypothetical protein PPERSA_04160 [Pseudocohnilembus persalinus]|eukprot:KRX03608.1 hypothetical protein PPERSA_04160 [Pseudocohnilembus persalinus]